ncbi:hypothetical protein KP509_36G062900 [Ceratopteris richardii]|uniref:Thioredoxin domain-containing protein n=1 Tax=Ceratopteris richardii TaxID=49495 RepID=A0A8T2QDT4_CERRI|nr:hypothetical protein KP509_36G062900 [Ceratopteris richardii]KAH7281790.1 hypothetical protein KP509_36G062900 [Ceratopteris richardii]KAH7281791.1 hypothetical protein KP509_36G062900 [Ceratopteris richardii]
MMAAAPAVAFIGACNPFSGISIQASSRRLTASAFTPSLSFRSNVPSTQFRPPIKSHVKMPHVTAMATGGLVKKVNAKELDAILDGARDCPIVVDFYATWCGPCLLLSQELEQLAAEYGEKVKFLKVDTDEEYELATDLKIEGLPTLVFVSKDAEKNAIRTEGLLPSDVIRNIIENEL